MGKKSDYEKLFGDSDFDFGKKKSKKKNVDLFMNPSKKKKKKKKKSKKVNINKVLERAVGTSETDLSDFIMFEEIKDTGIDTFEALSENARGLFVLEVKIDDTRKAFVPVFITEEGAVLHTETSKEITRVLAETMSDDSENISEVDLAQASDALKRAGVIEAIYNIDMNKLVLNIDMFKS